jgi:hypothetical protein
LADFLGAPIGQAPSTGGVTPLVLIFRSLISGHAIAVLPKPMGRVDLTPKLPGEDWGGGVELYSLPVPKNVGKNWQKNK